MAETKIPVDSIEIPERFVAVAGGWYNGMGCMLYAVSSTGGLTIGTIRPRGCDTDEKWYYSIWRDLSVDVMSARRAAESACNDYDEDYDDCSEFDELRADYEAQLRADYEALRDFEDWVDEQCERLCKSYGLEDWDG